MSKCKPNSLHPGRLTAGTYSHQPFGKENDLNQTSMIMFHVNLQGCKHSMNWRPETLWKRFHFCGFVTCISWMRCIVESLFTFVQRFAVRALNLSKVLVFGWGAAAEQVLKELLGRPKGWRAKTSDGWSVNAINRYVSNKLLGGSYQFARVVNDS